MRGARSSRQPAWAVASREQTAPAWAAWAQPQAPPPQAWVQPQAPPQAWVQQPQMAQAWAQPPPPPQYAWGEQSQEESVVGRKHRYVIDSRGQADGSNTWVWVVGTSMRPANFDRPDFDAYGYIQLLENTCCDVADVKRMWVISKGRMRDAERNREPGEIVHARAVRPVVAARRRRSPSPAPEEERRHKRARTPIQDVLLEEEEEGETPKGGGGGGAATK
jgi:hypothetical protein